MAVSMMSRGVVGQMATTPWPYRAITAPITTLLSLYLVAGVIHLCGVPWHWRATPTISSIA